MTSTFQPLAALTPQQQAIVPIAALAAAGQIDRLNAALIQGLEAGLTISTLREVLVQLYAYAGFPRSLNALGELMKVLAARQQLGIQDAAGDAPSHKAPQGADLLATGTANQTRLVGRPVAGPVFEFAPAIDEFLKTHLFGDIFERDNLDWQSREVATVAMLSALSGTDSQVQSHLFISMNIGLSAEALRQVIQILATQVAASVAQRAEAALARLLDK